MNELEKLEQRKQNFKRFGTIHKPRISNLKQMAESVLSTLPDWQQMTVADVVLNKQGC